MIELDPGHQYELEFYSGIKGGEPIKTSTMNVLTFMKREGEGYPENEGHYPGTNCQEVIRVLISRLKYLNNQIHDVRDIQIIEDLRQCLFKLECRAADRHNLTTGWVIDGWNKNIMIEDLPTCTKCGHILHQCE